MSNCVPRSRISVSAAAPALFALVALVLSGCEQKVSPKSSAGIFRLFDLFQPEDLRGKVTPSDVDWKPLEWKAQDLAASDASSPTNAAPLTYRTVQDIQDVNVDNGKLVGRLSGKTPVLDFALKANRGGAESVKVIEIRMSVSGGPKQLWVRADGHPAADDNALLNWASRTEPWTNAVDVADGKVQTYRFEISPAATALLQSTNAPATTNGPAPIAVNTGDLRHFALAFRDGSSGTFAISSVRLVSEREEKLKDPSGQQWAGLAEIYHATLAAKTPESIQIPLRELPERPWLELALGTKEDSPVKFKITIWERNGTNLSSPAVLLERTVTIPNRWQSVRLDLAAYTGKSVNIELGLSGDKKGLWGYWGSPMVRSHFAPGATAALTAPNGKRKPRGVILLVIDTLRKDHLNIYGYPRDTLVYLKKFAEEGAAFNHAISQGTMTKISVPSIVTSLYPMSHTVLGFDHGLPASAKTIAEVFRDEGYATVAYSSVAFTGKMNNMHQGYDELHEATSISDPEYHSKTSRHYVDRLIPWLQEHRDAPFFVFLHVFDPHSPFRPRPPYDTLWGAPGAKERLAELEADMKKHKIKTSLDNLPPKSEYVKTGNDPDELLKIYKDWYDGSIRGVDAEIGRLLEAMREMGLDQDTLMVWATDHGEEFWEHGRLFHGQSVYGELNQVPMVYHWPNSPDVRKGVLIDQQVQDLDIMPTILDLAGIQGPSTMQGRSLVPLLNGSGLANWQEQPAITQAMVSDNIDPRPATMGGPSQPAVDRAHFGIIDRGWKLVRKELEPDVQQELYQHPSDNLNLTNIIQAESSPAHVKSLLATLDAWKTRARAAQLPSDDTTMQQLSSEELRRLRALGYLGGGAPVSTNKPTNSAPKTSSLTNTPAVKTTAENATDKKTGSL